MRWWQAAPRTYPRKRLDLSWPDLLGLWCCALTALDRQAPVERLQQLWGAGDRCLPVYSVRSGLDLLLRAQRYPPGSMAVVTAVTIPDMARVLEAHGLEVRAVDLDRATLAPDTAELERLLTEHRGQVVLVLHAHLFGARADLDDTLRVTRGHGVLFVEDCAQAFDGALRPGHRDSDLALFSFGPVKTATALAGGIVLASPRQEELLARMRALLDGDPVLPRAHYLRRLAKYTALHLLSSPVLFSAVVAALRRVGKSPDDLFLHTHSFDGRTPLLGQLRRRPHAALLRAMHLRLSRYPADAGRRRAAAAEQVLAAVPQAWRLGSAAPHHSHWLLAVACPEPEGLLDLLRAGAVDASALSTSLSVVRAPERPAPVGCAGLLGDVVYVPGYPGLPSRERARIAALLRTGCSRALSAVPAAGSTTGR
jgi:perosamine synthetase